MTTEFLSGLSADLIHAAYAAAPGNEMKSGKFFSPESSSALVANTFGLFLDRPGDLPLFGMKLDWGWPPHSVQLEGIVRFPWSGGRHPCLDVLIKTSNALIGVESKRYEPFRGKPAVNLSDAYWRPVWGDQMRGYEHVRDRLRDGTLQFRHLDAVQLVKHAFGLRTAAVSKQMPITCRPILIYLHAEPNRWPDGRAIQMADIEAHRREIEVFAEVVCKDEVSFYPISYRDMLQSWNTSPHTGVREHVSGILQRFLL